MNKVKVYVLFRELKVFRKYIDEYGTDIPFSVEFRRVDIRIVKPKDLMTEIKMIQEVLNEKLLMITQASTDRLLFSPDKFDDKGSVLTAVEGIVKDLSA